MTFYVLLRREPQRHSPYRAPISLFMCGSHENMSWVVFHFQIKRDILRDIFCMLLSTKVYVQFLLFIHCHYYKE